MDYIFTKRQHFGAVLILGRSGWGKTWTVNRLIKLWGRNTDETVVHLQPDHYTSWNKWQDATITITSGNSVFTKFFKQVETIIIEDIQNSFLWNSSTRLKFLSQIKQIATHSNIIITLDPFGIKIPKQWTLPASWSHIIRLKVPSIADRLTYCKQDSFLSTLNTSQQTFLLETMKDVSFRSLERVRHFLQQSQIQGKTISFSVLRQATLSVGEIYLPPGLFSNAQEFVRNPNMSLDDLERIYIEDPFHFPYLIWNTLPNVCYYAGRNREITIDSYIELLDALLEIDHTSSDHRIVSFMKMYHVFHKGWRIISSVVFQIPNIRNKISYRKVRKKLLQKVVESADIPPMFIMERCREDTSIQSHILSTIKNKL